MVCFRDKMNLVFCARILVFCWASVEVATERRCKWNQLTIVSPRGILCWDCPECPTGLGLSPQCGSRITADTSIECVSCEEGESYSDEHDVSSCKPCTICDPNEETIRPCTVEENAVCGNCKAGYYRAVTGDCHPCSWCCSGNKEENLEKQCSEQNNLPPNKICRYDMNAASCGPASNTTPSTPVSENSFSIGDMRVKMEQHTWLVVLCVSSALLLFAVCIIGIAYRYTRKRRDKLCPIELVNLKPTQAVGDHHSSPVVAGFNSLKGTSI